MVEKKEISSQKAVSKLTTKFVSYGVLILALYKVIENLLQKTLLLNNFENNQVLIYVTLGLFFSIILLVTMHVLCRISTYDVLKKYRIKDTDIDIVCKKLTKVFLVFIILSIIITLLQLYTTLMYESKIQSQSIILSNIRYQNQYNEEFLDKLNNEIISNFYTYRTNLITYTFIIELGFCISLIAIIPFQKIMINKYNM